ncbi:hypothetical protein AUJ84_01300 [Candidatus Pacearchaeota archaeon CG1_02_32_132]|nr:MAG: hypothetical protein AUJ84_01300 [Candidatus Pacearchaeota archaeon CG1_02_32_132]
MVPKSFVVCTGEQHEIQHIVDGFFQERVCDLTREGLDRNLFHMRSGEISYNGTQVTDDRLTYLLYQDRVVAVVLETRTDWNQARYDFFENGLEDIKP